MVLHVHILEKGSFALKLSSFLCYRCQALFIQDVTVDKLPIGDVGYMYTHILARVNMVQINLE